MIKSIRQETLFHDKKVRRINPIARVMLQTRRRQSTLVKQNKKGKGSYARQNNKKLSEDKRQEID